jgi:hypothetical protein
MVLAVPRNVWEEAQDQGGVKPQAKAIKANVPDLAESTHGLKAVRCHYIDVCQYGALPMCSESGMLL